MAMETMGLTRSAHWTVWVVFESAQAVLSALVSRSLEATAAFGQAFCDRLAVCAGDRGPWLCVPLRPLVAQRLSPDLPAGAPQQPLARLPRLCRLHLHAPLGIHRRLRVRLFLHRLDHDAGGYSMAARGCWGGCDLRPAELSHGHVLALGCRWSGSASPTQAALPAAGRPSSPSSRGPCWPGGWGTLGMPRPRPAPTRQGFWAPRPIPGIKKLKVAPAVLAGTGLARPLRLLPCPAAQPC